MGSNLDRDQRLVRHVKDQWQDDPAGLFLVADAVRATCATEGWMAITHILEMEIAEIDRLLDTTNEPLSRAQYAQRHGRRDGLRAAWTAANAITGFADREYEKQRARHEDPAEPVSGRSA